MYIRNGISDRTDLKVAPFPSARLFFGGSLVRMMRFAITRNPRSMNATPLWSVLESVFEV